MRRIEGGRWAATLSWAWVALGSLLTVWTHVCMALGAFHVSVFDGSLFLLQSIYAARGMKPYVDYGFVYPPGPAWIFGEVLHLRSISELLPAVSLFNLIAVLACAWLLANEAKYYCRFVAGVALLCIGTLLPLACMWSFVDPCPLSLSSLTLLLALRLTRRSGRPAEWAAFGLVAAVATLWRWDRMLPAILIQIFAAASLGTADRFSRQRARGLRIISRRLLTVGLAGMCGVVSALALIAVVGIVTGSLTGEWDFIFRMPIAMSPYRRLPLPHPTGEDSQWLFDGASIVLLVIAVAWRARIAAKRLSSATLGKAAVLLSGPVGLLPYGLHRADGIHFLPVSASLVSSLLGAWSIWESVSTRRLLTAALCLALLPNLNAAIAQAVTQRLVPMSGMVQADVQNLTRECSALIPADARSMFVGNKSYQHYLMNLPIFYLANSRLRPATSLISEEPGIQNSCSYGSRIADDLAHAPRPLAILIDQTPWSNEANLSLNMQDCGKIQEQISKLSAIPVGYCSIGIRSLKLEIVR